jgi:hypothetical protein
VREVLISPLHIYWLKIWNKKLKTWNKHLEQKTGFDFSPSHLLQTFGTKNKKLARNVREGKNAEVSLLCTCACGCGDNLTVKQRDYNILVKNMKEFYYTKETIYPQELNWPMLISHFQPLHLES